jgi:hypothetical protein
MSTSSDRVADESMEKSESAARAEDEDEAAAAAAVADADESASPPAASTVSIYNC